MFLKPTLRKFSLKGGIKWVLLNSYGLTEKQGAPVASSRVIAEKFNKQHAHVLRDVEKALITFNEIGQSNFGESNFIKTHYKNEQNKKQPEYLLTKEGFSYIAMGFTGKKAASWKIQYINAFQQMENFIKNLYEAKSEFPEFTDAIMAAHEEPKHYHFSNECNMINSIVLGVTAKKFRELNSIENGKSIRPYLSLEQIEAIKTLQRIDIGLIVAVKDYQERKSILQDQYNRVKNKRLTA